MQNLSFKKMRTFVFQIYELWIRSDNVVISAYVLIPRSGSAVRKIEVVVLDSRCRRILGRELCATLSDLFSSTTLLSSFAVDSSEIWLPAYFLLLLLFFAQFE